MRLAVVVLAVVLAGCQGVASVPPSGVASPAPPSATATAGESPAASPTEASPAASGEVPPSAGPGLTRDSFAEVVTDDLRVRTKPGVGEDSIKLEPLLWDEAMVFVIDGPVAASGYDWYLVRPIGEVDVAVHPSPPDIGWVAAAGKDGEPWLAAYDFPCEATPWNLLAELEWPPHGLRGLACYRDTPLQFEAALVAGLGDCDGTLEPAWLSPCHHGRALADPAREAGDPRTLVVALDPTVDVDVLPVRDSGVEAVVNVTGQFDHPAARTCRLAPDSYNPPSELVILECRAQFVVTSVSIR
jgi:hypothetical protein